MTKRFFATLLLMPALLAQAPEATPAPQIAWSHNLTSVLEQSKTNHQPTLVFFTASWCVPCKQLKEQVCSTAEFAAAFEGYAFAMIDIDQDKAAVQAWQVGPIPDIRFVDANGEELGGFVGSRSLPSVLQARDAALQSGVRAVTLRAAVEKAPTDAVALLALAEHLLARPNKQPGVAMLQRAILAAAQDQQGIAARAHWLSIGANFQVLGRASAEDFADAQQRLARLDGLPKDSTSSVYADAARAWITWTETMRAWIEHRQQPQHKDDRLAVPDDAPLRQTLSRLCAAAAKPDAVAADAAADGLLIDGLLHYYAGDYPTGIARLTAFTDHYPAHRWHGEGMRFLGIVQRLQQQGGKK